MAPPSEPFPSPAPLLPPAGAAEAWQASRERRIDLSVAPILAILNLTPDSFSDGGSYPSVGAAVEAAERAAAEGAAGLDIGGESTRPGAERIAAEEQIRRTIPVIRGIRGSSGRAAGLPISIDTTLAAVAAAALDAGADAINDVSAGVEDPGMLTLAAERGAGVILMHRMRPPKGDSYSDQYREPPSYPNGVVEAVRAFLSERAAAAERAGVPRGAIVVDPGLGFGKTVEQNLELIRRTREIASLGYPVLSGLSRKSFVGRASGVDPALPARERAAGSVGLSVVHLLAGASIFRVHDVAAHAQALRAARAAAPPLRAGVR